MESCFVACVWTKTSKHKEKSLKDNFCYMICTCSLSNDNLDTVFEMYMIKSLQKFCVYKRYTIHVNFLKGNGNSIKPRQIFIHMWKKKLWSKIKANYPFSWTISTIWKNKHCNPSRAFLCLLKRKRAEPYAFVYIYPRRAVPYVHTYVSLRGLPYMQCPMGSVEWGRESRCGRNMGMWCRSPVDRLC